MDCSSTYAITNPDISGIGVRISFYVQTCALIVLVNRSWQDAPISLWTFIATSFGLTIAAITVRDELTFFQALQVSNLIWLANFGTFVALASYSRSKSHSRKSADVWDYNVKLGSMIQTIFSMALTLYMWATAKTFGPPALIPCTPQIRYIFFVIEASALGTGRTIALVFTAILTFLYLIVTFHELRSYMATRHRSKPSEKDAELGEGEGLSEFPSSHLSPSASAASPLDSSAHLRMPRPSHQRSFSAPLPTPTLVFPPHSRRRRRPKRRNWSASDHIDPMFMGIIIILVFGFIYFVTSSELLMHRNRAGDTDGNSDNIKGFGQILPLVVMLPSLLNVVGALRRNGFRKHTKPRDYDKTQRHTRRQREG